LRGTIVAATDDSNETGASTTDACTALTNASAVTGRIALIDRGNCTFVIKAKNAQDAGAIAVIVVDNVTASSPIAPGGSDPSVTIPVVGVTKTDGDSLRAQLSGNFFAVLAADPTRLAGADAAGNVKLYAPSTRSEEHTSELQSRGHLVCRLLL